MKIKIVELEGAALDWAVAFAVCPEHFKNSLNPESGLPYWSEGWLSRGSPSKDWRQGGPLIEGYRMNIICEAGNYWHAEPCDKNGLNVEPYCGHHGSTPLIAAMRAIVANELGEAVDVPEELLK